MYKINTHNISGVRNQINNPDRRVCAEQCTMFVKRKTRKNAFSKAGCGHLFFLIFFYFNYITKENFNENVVITKYPKIIIISGDFLAIIVLVTPV